MIERIVEHNSCACTYQFAPRSLSPASAGYKSIRVGRDEVLAVAELPSVQSDIVGGRRGYPPPRGIMEMVKLPACVVVVKIAAVAQRRPIADL